MTKIKHILFLSTLLMAFTGQANSEEAKAATEAIAEAAVEGVTDAMTEGATDAMTEGVTDAMAEGATEAVTEGVTDAMTEGVTDAMTEGATEAPEEAEEAICDMPAAPIIPDGNVASEDELVAAQKAMKMFQASIISFRNCLAVTESKVDLTSDAAVAKQDAILENYNLSVDAEARVADEFNAAVRAFKTRQE